jgi:putative endonuclease
VALKFPNPRGSTAGPTPDIILTLKPYNGLGQVQMKESYVYILASKYNGTLYIGLTSDLIRRIWEHKNKFVAGFTKEYNVTLLVHYEIFSYITLAAAREKRLKEWKRQWKIERAPQAHEKEVYVQHKLRACA